MSNQALNAALGIVKGLSTVALSDSNKGPLLIVENEMAHCQISLFGGHVLSFTPKHDMRERLWLSERAIFDGKTPIRGGIPICWPWFSAHHSQLQAPSHGYARNQYWQLTSANEQSQKTSLRLTPTTTDGFGYENLAVSLEITISNTLELNLVTTNKGDNPTPVTQALHTYLAVSDIDNIELEGVDASYMNKLDASKQNPCPNPYLFTQETDRIHVYNNADDTLRIEINDSCVNNTTKIEQQGHDSIVVWNPWKDKSATMKDMEANGYRTMVCVEAANTVESDHKLVIAAGATHVLTQRIS